MEATTKKTTKVKMDVSDEKKTGAEKPRYNKTWQALLDKPINMVVYDKTLFYR